MANSTKPLKTPFTHSADTTEQRSDQVVCFGSDDLSHIRVPEHQVSIRAHRDATLAGEQVEDLCRIRAGHCHKLVFVHFTSYLLENITSDRILANGHDTLQDHFKAIKKCLIYDQMKLTTHLSQIRDILSSVPLVPSGIKVKLSLPTARWEVWKVQ